MQRLGVSIALVLCLGVIAGFIVAQAATTRAAGNAPVPEKFSTGILESDTFRSNTETNAAAKVTQLLMAYNPRVSTSIPVETVNGAHRAQYDQGTATITLPKEFEAKLQPNIEQLKTLAAKATNIPMTNVKIVFAPESETIQSDPAESPSAPEAPDTATEPDPKDAAKLEFHAGGDPLRPLDGGYDTRTKSGREEITWLEQRMKSGVFIALYDVAVVDIAVDILVQSAVVVLASDVKVTEELRKRIEDAVMLYTGFERGRVMILNSPYE